MVNKLIAIRLKPKTMKMLEYIKKRKNWDNSTAIRSCVAYNYDIINS